MRSTAFVAVFLMSAMFMALNTQQTKAISPSEYFATPPGVFIELPIPQEEIDETEPVEDQPQDQEQPTEKPPETIAHVVVAGDTLIDVAEAHDTTWQRIFFKNERLENPDSLEIGMRLVIPETGEKLEERPLPEPTPPPAPAATTASGSTVIAAPRGSSAGNTYYYGYCTWYAKNMRPDLPNNLGNADTWTIRAASQGIPTGKQARVGAIAQQGMHVAYVEQVHADGTVTLSEMNFVGWNVVSTRRVAASNFNYIY